MAKIYVRQIKAGKITLADVPQRWRSQVEALMNESGVQNG